MFVAFDAVATPGAPLFEEEGVTVSFGLLLNVECPIYNEVTVLSLHL